MHPLIPSLAQRLANVRAATRDAALRARRDPDSVEIVAVSKTHPPESVRAAIDEGQSLFGESRIQEARAKIPLVPGRARWHFIGHLQKNKVRHALALGFELLHGIDSLALAEDLNRVAGEMSLRPRVLLEINTAGEASKFGFSPGTLPAQMENLLQLNRLDIDGLMTIAPLAPAPEASRKYFVALRELRDRLATQCGCPLRELSMGMSGDFVVAIEEGATLVRVGSAIFGPRQARDWRRAAEGTIIED
jgi:pyridoxal phosphate enzyme (YggS family)